jgi:hypothetical protein
MLGSIAGGKWILHPSYIKDSMTAGIWLKVVYRLGNKLRKPAWLALPEFLFFNLPLAEKWQFLLIIEFLIVLQEDEYEWGNPAKGFTPLDNGSIEAKLAIAARRTREGKKLG